MLPGDPYARMSLYRRHKRLAAALDRVLSEGLINSWLHAAARKEAEALYSKWREERKRIDKPYHKRPGRKPKPSRRGERPALNWDAYPDSDPEERVTA